MHMSRRDLLARAAGAVVAVGIPTPLFACAANPAVGTPDPDRRRLEQWVAALRSDERPPTASLGHRAARVGELAAGTPYEAQTLEAYLAAGGSPEAEPLILSLTRFDCVTLVEACIAVARVAASAGAPTWERFAQEMERMRYRGGVRRGYGSRLHYFSEWIGDGARRGLVRDLGRELGGVEDTRPLRFMSEHRSSYPALESDEAYREVVRHELRLDESPRVVVPTARIPEVADRIDTGDIVAFATSIPGLDVSHAAFAYRDGDGVLRVLHAPLSGGVVEITRATLPEYVAAIRRSTGILVARPLPERAS